MSANCDIIIFQFMANWEQSGSWILDAQSVKIKFLLKATFYLINTGNRTKKTSNTALTLLLRVKVSFLPKNSDFLQINTDFSKIKMALVLIGIFSEAKYVCVLTTKFHVSSIILTRLF